MPTLLLATTNEGKVREFRDILSQFPELHSLHIATPDELGIVLPEVIEDGDTFQANAVLKARSASNASGLPTLADDSGLCVDALGGAPGLLSARWAGPNASDQDRISLLLKKLKDVPEAQRTARFVCAAAVCVPGKKCVVTEAACDGVILHAPHGVNGFGYDPVFFLPTHGQTMAELADMEKNNVSHRALALHNLMPHLAALRKKTFPPARLDKHSNG